MITLPTWGCSPSPLPVIMQFLRDGSARLA
jgi:hypothetical protein